MSSELLTIGKVSQRTGCNIETIRFYEKEGLLPAPGRTAGGHRLYGSEDVKRLVFVCRCRELGFSMHEIRQLSLLVDCDNVSCKSVKAIADEHLRDVRSKLDELKKVERVLRRLSDQCSGADVPQCPIMDVLCEH